MKPGFINTILKTTAQLKQWLPKSRKGPLKAKASRSGGKFMATILCHARGKYSFFFIKPF